MSMGESIRQITIVGGGTAGWWSALSLHARLAMDRRGPPIKISLIESPGVPIIGVGEGTLPGFVGDLLSVGLDESEFVTRCNASIKLGVRFVNWNLSEAGRPYAFTHPFGYGPMCRSNDPVSYFLAFGPHGGTDPFDVADSFSAGPEMIRLRRAPQYPDPPSDQ